MGTIEGVSEDLLEGSSKGDSKGASKGTTDGVPEVMSDGKSERTLERMTDVDSALEGELDVFKEVDSLAVLEGVNEPNGGLLGSDGFVDGDLNSLEEGFVGDDGALEAFETGFYEGTAEVRVDFDAAAIAGESVVGETVGLTVGEVDREVVGDATGMLMGAVVRGTIRETARVVVATAVRVLVGGLVATRALAGADSGEGVLHLCFCIVFFGRSAFL